MKETNNETMNKTNYFDHIPANCDPQTEIYQLRADIRELHKLLDAANATISSKTTDAESYHRLAIKNQEEADALRRAAGVSCDDTIGEGIAKVAELRKCAASAS